MKNKHIGSNFDEFLESEHILDEVSDLAIKKVIAHQIESEMKSQNISKTQMAKMMKTSRATVNRLLEPNNCSLTLHTLSNAARVLGKSLNVSLG